MPLLAAGFWGAKASRQGQRLLDMKNENEILLETLFVNFVNENAEKIKAMAAFKRLTKAELLALEETIRDEK